jgi:hypothetical protein
MVKRFAFLASIAVGAALLATAGASADAGGQGTVTQTFHFTNVPVFSFHATNPCNGQPGTLSTFASTEVFHVTFFTNGDEFWFTGTAQGTATFTPDNAGGISASGHFAAWFGESSNNQNDVQHDTNTFVLNGTDGSRVVLHIVDHVSINANGVVNIQPTSFDFHCG